MPKKINRQYIIYSIAIVLMGMVGFVYHKTVTQQVNEYDAVKPLHNIHQMQIIFAQCDARLAFYYYEGNFSDNARIDMIDRYDIFTDYLDLLNSNNDLGDDDEILSLLAELKLFITQWRLVLDKIFVETADYQSILPLTNSINHLLEALANRQDELLKIRFNRTNDFER
ncbi:MAG: hypothetical protein K0U39_03540 [Alphaproteobacteria bacterium]|nr:hypothetical protein [Alphaproteobacteria bacterium]